MSPNCDDCLYSKRDVGDYPCNVCSSVENGGTTRFVSIRTGADVLYNAAIAEERCAKICESSAERYEGLAIAARESRGPMSNSEANEYLWAAECARQQAKMIRGVR